MFINGSGNYYIKTNNISDKFNNVSLATGLVGFVTDSIDVIEVELLSV